MERQEKKSAKEKRSSEEKKVEQSSGDSIELKYDLKKYSPVKSVKLQVDLNVAAAVQDPMETIESIENRSKPILDEEESSGESDGNGEDDDNQNLSLSHYSSSQQTVRNLLSDDENSDSGAYLQPKIMVKPQEDFLEKENKCVLSYPISYPETPQKMSHDSEDSPLDADEVVTLAIEKLATDAKIKSNYDISKFIHPEKRVLRRLSRETGNEYILSPMFTPVYKKYKEHIKCDITYAANKKTSDKFEKKRYKLYKIDLPIENTDIAHWLEKNSNNAMNTIIDRVLYTNDNESDPIYLAIKATCSLRSCLLANIIDGVGHGFLNDLLNYYVRKLIISLTKAFKISNFRIVAVAALSHASDSLNVDSSWGIASSIQAYYNPHTDTEIYHQIYYQALGLDGFVAIYFIK